MAERGFTLVELVLTMVIISIAALGVMTSLSFAVTHQSDGLWQARAVALARSYFEEIQAKRYDENTPNGGVPRCSPATTACSAASAFDDGESRSAFDDVDDYHGVSDLPPLDAEGSARSGYDRFQVDVSVRYLSSAEVTSLGVDDITDAKVVTVLVTPPNGRALSFTQLRGNY